MYAGDHPDELKFTRPGEDPSGVEKAAAKAAWADVLMGEAYNQYISTQTPSAETLAALRGSAHLTSIQPMVKKP